MAALATHASASASNADYKALVCVFMNGGNDSHNWIVPTDAAGYAEYARSRSSLALPMAALRNLTSAGRQAAGRGFAMPVELDPLRDLYERGQLAVLSNVGPMLQPTTKADFVAGSGLPPKLFSHNDQASSWQAMAPEGARSGWGGRMADALLSANAYPAFTSVSATGNAVFLSGATATQYQLGNDGAVGIDGLSKGSTLGSSSVAAVLRRTQGDGAGSAFQADYAKVVGRSIDAYGVLSTAMAGAAVPAVPRISVSVADGGAIVVDQLPLARQLRSVAQMIAVNQTLGMRRQVFMVSISGFDTHQGQLRDHPRLSASVAHSVAYFMGEMARQGMADKVTLFTASDFGRTLTSNGAGSDHGWGSHHFVAGGAVRGRDIYGRFPLTALGTADDIGSGRLLPGISVTQYAAVLGNWLGVPASDLQTALPNLNRFSTSDLGFV